MIIILTKTNNKKHATKKYKMKRTKRNKLRQGVLCLCFFVCFSSEDSGNPNLHFSLEKRNEKETIKKQQKQYTYIIYTLTLNYVCIPIQIL